jgi:hypothetical protein
VTLEIGEHVGPDIHHVHPTLSLPLG